MKSLSLIVRALLSIACLLGVTHASQAAAEYEHPSLAYGDPGIAITGWSRITCNLTPWKDPGFPKAINFDCVATITGRIANAGSDTHFRLKAWFMDSADVKGHLPLGFQPSDDHGDPAPTFVGNGEVSVRVEASGSDEEGDCPAGEYLVEDVHLEAVFDFASGGSESYLDNKKGRVTVVCNR